MPILAVSAAVNKRLQLSLTNMMPSGQQSALVAPLHGLRLRLALVAFMIVDMPLLE